jgi:hypothetical protein
MDVVPSENPLSSCTLHSAREATRVPHASLPSVFRIEERILISPARPAGTPADDAAPTRIGFLSDMPASDQLGGYLDPIILALEDAMIEGRLCRPVELTASHVIGLPVGVAENVIAAYVDLVEQGCIIVLSTGVTNNALVLRDTINNRAVPLITMALASPASTVSRSRTAATAKKQPSWPPTWQIRVHWPEWPHQSRRMTRSVHLVMRSRG